jgi:hypothetical protein
MCLHIRGQGGHLGFENTISMILIVDHIFGRSVVFFFWVIWNPRWPPWSLIGQDIFYFFSRTTTCGVSRIMSGEKNDFYPAMTAFTDQYIFWYWSVINRTYKCKLCPHRGTSGDKQNYFKYLYQCCHCRIELSSVLLSQCSLNMLDKRSCIWSKLPYMRKTSVPHLLVNDGDLWRALDRESSYILVST